jgi:hypothetical protein
MTSPSKEGLPHETKDRGPGSSLGTSDFSTSGGLTSGGINFLVQIVSGDCSMGGCVPFSSRFQLLGSAPGAFDGLDWGTGAYLISLGSQSVPPAEPEVYLSTGDCFSITIPDNPGQVFVGFTSTTPLSSVVFTIDAGLITPDEIFLDNFAICTAIPEPRRLSLILLGLAVLLSLWATYGEFVTINNSTD